MFKTISVVTKRFVQSRRFFSIVTKYSKDHEWIKFNQNTGLGSVGITDHAQAELGDIVHIDMPKVGEDVAIGDCIGGIESVKVAADIFVPVTGQITQVGYKITLDQC